MVDMLIQYALQWVGYLEKKSNKDLDNFTANAGTNNFTRFARDYAEHSGINVQGQPWCDVFVDECFINVFGVDKAKTLLGGFSAYTPTSANNFKKMGRWYTAPQRGDVIFYKNETRIYHTGIVVKVEGGKVYTVEGNTSNASGVVANGGGVAAKSYSLTYGRIAGYGRPAYMNLAKTFETSVTDCQVYLNKNYKSAIMESVGALLKEDNKFGAKSRYATLVAWKVVVNEMFKTDIKLSNAFTRKCRDMANKKKMKLKYGDKGPLVYILQILLRNEDMYTGPLDGEFNMLLCHALYEYRKANGWKVDGYAITGHVCTAATWKKLLS